MKKFEDMKYAEDMFKELGYTEAEKSEEDLSSVLMYYIKESPAVDGHDAYIRFYKDRTFAKYGGSISVEEFKAIEQQMKELEWIEMSAEEMFGFLGFELVKNDKHSIRYQRASKVETDTIEFDIHNMGYSLAKFQSGDKTKNFIYASYDLIKAIDQQRKELGWI